jgi:hypothetical protein
MQHKYCCSGWPLEVLCFDKYVTNMHHCCGGGGGGKGFLQFFNTLEDVTVGKIGFGGYCF